MVYRKESPRASTANLIADVAFELASEFAGRSNKGTLEFECPLCLNPQGLTGKWDPRGEGAWSCERCDHDGSTVDLARAIERSRPGWAGLHLSTYYRGSRSIHCLGCGGGPPRSSSGGWVCADCEGFAQVVIAHIRVMDLDSRFNWRISALRLSHHLVNRGCLEFGLELTPAEQGFADQIRAAGFDDPRRVMALMIEMYPAFHEIGQLE